MASEENPVSTEDKIIDDTKQSEEMDEMKPTDGDAEQHGDDEDKEEEAKKGKESTKDEEKKDEDGDDTKQSEEMNKKKPADEDAEQHSDDKDKEQEAKKSKESTNDEEKKDEDGRKPFTPRSSRSSEMRDYMTAELERVRKEMMSSASLIKRPESKAFTPDIFNDLSPYYNTYLIDYAMKDQDMMQKPWGSYGQRETAVNIVEPEVSLKMDTFPLPPVRSNVPGQLFKMKIWSKNLSGKDQELGSTRLPQVPSLAVKKMPNPEYQYFQMTYNEVPKFREDVRKMYSSIGQERAHADYERVQKDWKRMNLNELKDLPQRSRFHYGKAVTTYLGTSRGSLKAVNKLAGSLNGSETS